MVSLQLNDAIYTDVLLIYLILMVIVSSYFVLFVSDMGSLF
jgi:hypothetical protein